MAAKGVEQSWTAMFGSQRAGDFLGSVIDILGNEVGHLAILGLPPAVVNDVQLRSIGWEQFDMHARAIEVMEPPRRFAVAAEAMPGDRQGALEVLVELL